MGFEVNRQRRVEGARTQKRRSSAPASIVAGLVIIAVGIFGLFGGNMNWVEVQAEILTDSTGKQVMVGYEYGGNEYRAATDKRSDSWIKGDVITISINPNRPEECRKKPDLRIIPATILIGTVAVFMGVYEIAYLRRYPVRGVAASGIDENAKDKRKGTGIIIVALLMLGTSVYFWLSVVNVVRGGRIEVGHFSGAVVSAMMGIAFMHLGVRTRRSATEGEKRQNRLHKEGMLLHARISDCVEDTEIRNNGRSPYKIKCIFNAEGHIIEFWSDRIWRDVPEQLRIYGGETLPVLVNPNDWTDYHVDVSVLGQSVL